MDFDKIINNNGIYLYQDESFNTITIKLNFLADNGNKESAILEILGDYLESCNKNFKTDDDINKREQELYSLKLNFNSPSTGNQRLFCLNANLISMNSINDDYSKEAFEFIRQMLKEPDFTNKEMLKVIKRNRISEIEVDLSDVECYSYCLYGQKVLYDKNKEYDYSVDKNYIKNIINSITLDDLKHTYENVMNNFQCGLVLGNISENDFNSFVEHISLKPNNKNIDYSKNVSTTEEEIEEEKKCDQSYIYITFDMDKLTYAEYKLLYMIMNSSLGICFQTLREKYGLVYNSYAGILKYYNKMYIYGQIDKDNKDKFIDCTDEIINILNNKELLEEYLVQAKEQIESLEYNLSEDFDQMVGTLNQYIMGLYEGKDRNIISEEIKELTAEDLIKKTKTLQRKNIFMLRGSNNE